MNRWPVQVALIDCNYTQGSPAQLDVLSSDFPEEPPHTITIYDVTWVRAEPTIVYLQSDSRPRRRVRYRSTTPVTTGFLRYLNHVLTDPYASRRFAIQ